MGFIAFALEYKSMNYRPAIRAHDLRILGCLSSCCIADSRRVGSWSLRGQLLDKNPTAIAELTLGPLLGIDRHIPAHHVALKKHE